MRNRLGVLAAPLVVVAIGCAGSATETTSAPTATTAAIPSSITEERSEPITTPPAPTISRATTTTASRTSVRSDESATIFDATRVHSVRLDLAVDDLAQLTTQRTDRVKARLDFDGRVLNDVGLRLKQGSGSRREYYEKAGFNLETDEFVDDQALLGIRKFTLGNSIQDRSFMSETLTYEVFRRAGIPAPRTILTNVWVNGELFGLYVMRETMDSQFLRRNFAQPDGNLYEGRIGVDITDVAGLDPKTNEKKNDTSALQRLATVVADVPDSEFIQRVSELVDLDEFFVYWAVEAIVFHWDGYALGGGGFGSQSPNNYYVYLDDPDGRFVFLPWGADTTLGAGISPYQYPLIPSLQAPNPGARFASRLYAIAEGRDRLRQAILSVLDRAWDADQLLVQANAIAQLVRGSGLTSSREEATIETFEAEVANRASFIASRSATIHAQLVQ